MDLGVSEMLVHVIIVKNHGIQLGVVAHACNPNTLGGGDRRIRVRGQPQLLSEVLCNFMRLSFKIKYKK